MMWLDYVLLAIVGLSALYSVFRGFVREVLSLISWVLSVWVAIKFSPHLANYLSPYIDIPELRFIASFILIFLGIMFTSILLSRLVVGLLQVGGLRVFDRLVGAGFGLARGVIIAGVLVLLGSQSPLSSEPAWQQSLVVPYLQRAVAWASDQMPANLMSDMSARAESWL